MPYLNGQVVPGVPYNRYFDEPGFTEIEAETLRDLLQLEHRWNESHRTTLFGHAARNDADGANFMLYNFSGPFQDPVTGDISRAAEGLLAALACEGVWDWISWLILGVPLLVLAWFASSRRPPGPR